MMLNFTLDVVDAGFDRWLLELIQAVLQILDAVDGGHSSVIVLLSNILTAPRCLRLR